MNRITKCRSPNIAARIIFQTYFPQPVWETKFLEHSPENKCVMPMDLNKIPLTDYQDNLSTHPISKFTCIGGAGKC